jgi:DNA repair exonuclease SbcCD ATPase subunit
MKRGQHSPSPARPRSNGNGSSNARWQTVRPNATLAARLKRLSTRMDQIESELNQIKFEQIEKNAADLSVQFQRIAMMQAEIDHLKANEAALHVEIDRLRVGRSDHAEPKTPKA